MTSSRRYCNRRLYLTIPQAATHALSCDDAIKLKVRSHKSNPDGDLCYVDAVEPMR